MTSSSSPFTIHLTVTGVDGAPRVPLTIDDAAISSTQLRKKASEATEIPLAQLKMIFRGRLIGDNDDQSAVNEFKLEEGSVLHCMGKPVSANNTNSSTAATTPAPSAPEARNNNGNNAASLPASLMMQPPSSAARPPSMTPRSAASPLTAALATLRNNLSPSDYSVAVQTLEKLVTNIVAHPMEEKYRRLKKHNAAFARKLGDQPGGAAAVHAAGFVSVTEDGTEYYALHASAEAWPNLLATQRTLQQAVSAAATPPVTASGMTSPSTQSPSNMNQAAADFLSNPGQVQAMLQNPAVQNMIRNDPRLAGSQQQIEHLLQNPALMQQASQMMRDPAMMERMQQMMGGMGGVNPPGGMGGGINPSPTGANANNSNNNAANAGGNDAETTEEEMIAEAIRRSLQDDS